MPETQLEPATAAPPARRRRSAKAQRMPASDVLQLWLVRLADDPGGLNQRAFSLPADEESRGARFARADLRARFRLTRALVRHIVGQACQIHPGDVAFATGLHGKPSLADFPALAFNASHSQDRVLIGLLHTGAAEPASHGIGVDIEAVRDLACCMDIAQRVFEPARVASLASLGGKAQQAHFFQHWVEWEARLKARGLGIAAAESAGLLRTLDHGLLHGRLDAGRGYAAAWASQTPVSALSIHTCEAALGAGGHALAFAQTPAQHVPAPSAAWRLQ